MVKSVQRGHIGRGVLPKAAWPWEDWLDALWDRKQGLKLDLFRFLPERKIQAALRRQLKPGDQSEDKRFPRLAPVKYNPRLTKGYLAPTPENIKALERELLECLLILHGLKPRGILDAGGIRVYPAGKTGAKLKTKMGRPPFGERAMSDLERQQRQRGKAPSPPLLIGSFPWKSFALPPGRRRKKVEKNSKPSRGILGD